MLADDFFHVESSAAGRHEDVYRKLNCKSKARPSAEKNFHAKLLDEFISADDDIIFYD